MKPDSPWSLEKKRRLEELWHAGVTTRLIGADLGVSHNSVISMARRMALPPRPSPIKNRTTPTSSPKPRPPAVNSAAAVAHARAVGVKVWRYGTSVSVRPSTITADTRSFEAIWFDGEKPPRPVSKTDHHRLPIPVGAYAPARTCQWPTSDGRPWSFCGCASVPGRSYCADHTAIAYRLVVSPRDEPETEFVRGGRFAMNTRSWA